MTDTKKQCSKDGCARSTCLPPEYQPLCTKHYIESVKRAEKAAEERFAARIRTLEAAEHQRRMAEETR